MKFEVADFEKSQKKISVEVPYEKFNEYFEKEYSSIKPKVKIPGFRPGKAPKDIIIREYKHKINVEALEKLVSDTINNVFVETKIMALSRPAVKDVFFEEDKPITFNLYVDVFPTFELIKYKGFEFTKTIYNVTEEDIQTSLNSLREKNMTYVPRKDDEAAQNGDMVDINFLGKLDGVPFENGSAKGYSLVLGSNTFIPGFEDQIIGMKSGDEKDITVKFPDEYHEKSLAGKDVVFEVALNGAKEKVLPELDDSFAAQVDVELETLDQLKEQIKSNLIENAAGHYEDALYDSIMTKLIAENPFELPETMIDQRSIELAEIELAKYARYYGMDPKKMGIDISKMKSGYREMAEKQLKGAAILNKLADIEKINVTDEDVDNHIKEISEKSKEDYETFRGKVTKGNGIENIKNYVLSQKIFNYLCDNNTITEKDYVPGQDAPADVEGEA